MSHKLIPFFWFRIGEGGVASSILPTPTKESTSSKESHSPTTSKESSSRPSSSREMGSRPPSSRELGSRPPSSRELGSRPPSARESGSRPPSCQSSQVPVTEFSSLGQSMPLPEQSMVNKLSTSEQSMSLLSSPNKEQSSPPLSREQLPLHKEQSMMPLSKEQSMLPSHKEQSMMPVNKEQSMIPLPKEQSMMPLTKEQSMIPLNKEQSMIPLNKESTVPLLAKETTPLTPLTKEQQFLVQLPKEQSKLSTELTRVTRRHHRRPESPARLAARRAAGWERFLGGPTLPAQHSFRKQKVTEIYS